MDATTEGKRSVGKAKWKIFITLEIIGAILSAYFINRGYIGIPPCYADRFNCFGTSTEMVIIVFIFCSIVAYVFSHLVTRPSSSE